MITGGFRAVRELVELNQIISSDQFLRLAGEASSIVYYKRDFLFRSGTWRGVPYPSLLSRKTDLENKTLIIGHSDTATNARLSKLIKRLKGPRKIYGTNLEPYRDLASPIPLGVTNSTQETELHPVLGNNGHFLIADQEAEFSNRFYPSIYANFTSANNKSSRGKLLGILANLPKSYRVTVAAPEFTDAGRIGFLSQCRASTFTVCPEGNGVDTHRLWETLYMGGVPVVTPNRLMDSLYRILPVVVLKDWKELEDPALLEAKWNEVSTMKWDDEVLRQSFWNNIILG